VADQPWAVFLDSGVIAAKRPVNRHADYDVLAIKPRLQLVTRDLITNVTEDSERRQIQGDPLAILRDSLRPLEQLYQAGKPLDCPYLPGAIGYFSYDLARRFEQLPETAVDDEGLPAMAVGIYDVIVVVDHREKTTALIGRQNHRAAVSLAAEWRNILKLYSSDGCPETDVETPAKLRAQSIEENMSRQRYAACFQAVRDYTIAGDCYQVNLAKRFTARVKGDSWQTYAALRAASPAPYGAYFNFPFAQVLSNSPESFIQCRDGRVITSPIKGTSARDHDDPANDRRIARQLLQSRKDRAENLMIVDLMRNDLSKCCELGSVAVPKLFALHSFANVHHLISTITGVLRKNLHVLDLLRNCFPGGSITGAPKIRAMQIIEELEPHRRGLYCGAMGYVGVDGSLETNIAIRTIVVKDGVARFSAGGGLVIDSGVAEEYQEIIDKARMMTQALTGQS
ncbi:MAG: aminodeoxychorismate synthase component I, partial [Gammaproteobacteria bacterium]|nr:aminodeoxychorismate synthase component I [Gammaproteobacteria bacterium]